MLLQGPRTQDEDRLIGGVGHQGLIETSLRWFRKCH
jgi:hypothetical protein